MRFCLMFLLILELSIPTFSTPAFGADRVKIGISTALTGPAASFGLDIKNAVMFASKTLAPGKYEFVVEDDHCSGRDAVSVAHKLVNDHKVKAVFGNCSATVLSAAPIYDKAGVIVMAPLASSSAISTAGDYVFRTISSDALAAKELYRYIAAKQKKIGVLTEQSDYSQDFYSEFESNNKQGQLVIKDESFLPSDTDFRSVLLKFKSSGIDGIFINSNTEQSFALVLKQLRQLGLDTQIYGAIIPGSSAFLKLAGADANGIIFVDFPQTSSALNEEGRKLHGALVKELGNPNSWDITFATSFEAFRAVDLALSSGQDPREYLYNNKFNGMIGEYSFDKNGDIVGLRPSFRKIEGGKFVTLAE